MKTIIQIIGIAGLAIGCSTYVTDQTRTEYNLTNGNKIASITTKVKTRTLFDSKSELQKSSVSQSDKTQASRVGNLTQEANSTNAVAVLHELANIVSALPK